MNLKLLLISVLFNGLISNAFAGYGSKGKGGGGGGGGGGGCYKCGGGGGGGSQSINAAVISKHSFQVKEVPSSSDDVDIPTIVINSGSTPLKIQMGSSSSDIEIEQAHSNSKPQEKHSSSVDGAIIMKHYVKKPIIQYVHEKIIPQRKIVQEVLPVKEFIKTIVSQDKDDGGAQTTAAPDDYPQPGGGGYGQFPPPEYGDFYKR